MNNGRKRVMLLSYCLDLGGSERQLTEVACNLDRDRFEPYVGCLHPNGLRAAQLERAGVPIVRFPVRSFFSIGAARQGLHLASYVRKNRIDLVHAFDVPMDIFGVPAGRLAARAVVLSSQRAHRSLTTGPRLQMLRFSDRLSDGIVVNCRYIEQHLVNDERIEPKKIHLCYNGLDLASFPFTERDHKIAGVTVGCVCALREEKNLPVLVRAFAAAREKAAGLKLLLVGSGPLESDLRKLIGELGISDCARMLPATRDVPERLRDIDVFVLPSRTEAFSNSLMEAMASGCAVIASAVGGNPELVGKEERGLLFSSGDPDALADSIAALARDPDRRAGLSRAARGFVEDHLSIAASVRRMSEIYETFFGKS